MRTLLIIILALIVLACSGCEFLDLVAPVRPFPPELQELGDQAVLRAERYRDNQGEIRLAQAKDLTANIVAQMQADFQANIEELEAAGGLTAAQVMLKWTEFQSAVDAARAAEADKLAEYAATEVDIEDVMTALRVFQEVMRNPGMTTEDYLALARELAAIFMTLGNN